MNKTPHKRDSLLQILLTLCFNGDNTVKVRSAVRDLTRKIKQTEYEIATQINDPTQTDVRSSGLAAIPNLNKRHFRVKTVDDLIAECRRYKLERVLKRDNAKKRVKYVRKSRRINSSAFVGYIWRYLNVLPEDGAKPWEIRPQQFADSKIEVPLAGNTRLGHVQFVKTANESNKINDSDSKRYRDSKQNKWEQKGSQNPTGL